jgi:hypothetical protein
MVLFHEYAIEVIIEKEVCWHLFYETLVDLHIFHYPNLESDGLLPGVSFWVPSLIRIATILIVIAITVHVFLKTTVEEVLCIKWFQMLLVILT